MTVKMAIEANLDFRSMPENKPVNIMFSNGRCATLIDRASAFDDSNHLILNGEPTKAKSINDLPMGRPVCWWPLATPAEVTALCMAGENDYRQNEMLWMLGGYGGIETWNVHQYHFVDLDFSLDPSDVCELTRGEFYELEQLIEAVKRKLRLAGWQGDGALRVAWIPPFVTGYGDTCGRFVWHVKQGYKSTTFILAPNEFRPAES